MKRLFPPAPSLLRLIAPVVLICFVSLPFFARGQSEGARRLEASLAETQWLWHGKEDMVLTFRRNGTFDLDSWARQGITAVWGATDSNRVTVTVTSAKFRNLTATLIFANDLLSFTGTDLDKNRAIERSPRLDETEGPLPTTASGLTRFLAGTKWLWYGREDRVVTLSADGRFILDDWTRQGITAKWRATGPKEVTVTVTSQKFRNLTAVLVFDSRLSSYTGTDLDPKRKISPSPRLRDRAVPGIRGASA